MIDPHSELRSYLVNLPAFADVSLWAGRAVPPEGYMPGDGDGIAFKIQAGSPDYGDTHLQVTMQFKCYSTSEVNAYALYRTLYDELHGAVSAAILQSTCETLGQPLEEPDTEWPFVLTYFRMKFREV